MIVLSQLLISIIFLLVFFIQPCIALDLIVSDSGRNQSFSSKLNSGDNFSVIGADGKPVGGTLAGTHSIEQFLVPMPSKIELEQMSASQEKIWTKNLGGMLKDRVHIATTNGAEVFEIRLLQDTPKPGNKAISWQEPANTDRYANMTYRAIGQLVKDLKEQETPVRITAALADSGGSAFARSVKAWKSYADTFRRVDFVDARAMHSDVRQVIKTLSPKRVRIINTDGSVAAPPMTIARSKVANNLLASNPGLSAYTLKPDLKNASKPDTTPWMNSLAGHKSYSVERMQYVDNKIVNHQLARTVTGQDFRAPKRGWDPVNNNMRPAELLNSLGILPVESYNEVVPNLHRSLATGNKLRPADKHGSVSDIPAFFALAGNAHDNTQLKMQMKQLVDVSTDFKNVYVVGKADSKLTRQLAESIAFNIGSDRVQIINSSDDIRRSQSLVRSNYNTAIVGWKKKFDTTYKNASFLVNRDVADTLVKGASALQSSVEAMESFPSAEKGEAISPFKAMLANKYSERLGEHKWLSPTFRTVKRASGLLESVNKDISRVNQGQFRWVTSDTVKKIGEIGAEVMTSTEFLDKALKNKSALYKPLQKVGSAGGIDAIRAVSRISRSGNWNPKKWDIETWELVTDSFSDATAYGLGSKIGGHKMGEAFQASAALARVGLRSSTQPLFDMALGARRGNASIAVAQYENAVSRAVIYDTKIPSSENWFSKDMRDSLKINKKDFNRIKEYEDSMRIMQKNNQSRESQRVDTYKTIQMSVPKVTSSATKPHMRFVNSQINRQTSVSFQGRGPELERIKYDYSSKISNEPIQSKHSAASNDSPFDYISRQEAHSLADVVYDADYGESRLPAGWKLHKGQIDKLSGIKYAIYKRESDGQRVLSYAGTRNLVDWGNNIIDSGSLYLFDKVLPAISKRSIHLQVDRAHQVMLSALHENKYSKSNRPLIAVADSKGGLFVQYGGAMTQTLGATTHTAPMGNDLLSRISDSGKKFAEDGGIRHLAFKDEFVSNLNLLPGSTILGVKDLYDVPKVFREAYKKTISKYNPLAIPGILFTIHTQRDLLGRAIRDRAINRNNIHKVNDPLGIKRVQGTTIRMKPSTPAYRTVFPTLSRYENAKYGNTMQSWRTQRRDPYIKLPEIDAPNIDVPTQCGGTRACPPMIRNDLFVGPRRPDPISISGWEGPDPPDGGGGLSMRGGLSPYRFRDGMSDHSSRMFPVSYKINDANMNRYLPISTIGQQRFGQPNVRGVLLKGAASLNKGAEAFAKGDVSLIFQDSAGEIDIDKLRRFVTSLWASYLSVEGPGISIDPAEPKMDYQKVRHIGQVKNTYLARVMRETDYLMKQWAIGTHRPDIEGFLTSDDFSELLKKQNGKERVTGRPSRFWLVPEGLAFTRSGNMLLLSGGRMTVQTEYLDDNPKGEKNEANEAFAKWFTNDYSRISAHYPIFQELFDYAQLVSLATYLRENRVPMLKFLLANRELILTEKSIDKVDKLKKKSDYEWNISISGGVALEATESVRDQRRYKTDESLREAFNEADKESRELDALSDTVVFNSRATDYTVTSNQSLMLSGSPATGDIVQTDFAYWKEFEEAAGKEKWSLVTPAMELIRYYNPNIKSRAQLGPGWHLLVPFRLENSEVSKPLVAGVLPSRIAMVNLLSGEREIMKRTIDQKTNRINYIPLDKNAFVSLLVPLSNGTWVLRDRLGATFRFDKEGDLTHMELRPEKTISFKVGDKAYRKKIPGYIVEYKYKTKVIAGRSQKLLMSARQGNEIVRITRVVDKQSNHIASIQILHVGQGNPIEILTYMYNKDDRLARVINKNGHSIEIAYNDDEMQVVSTRK